MPLPQAAWAGAGWYVCENAIKNVEKGQHVIVIQNIAFEKPGGVQSRLEIKRPQKPNNCEIWAIVGELREARETEEVGGI